MTHPKHLRCNLCFRHIEEPRRKAHLVDNHRIIAVIFGDEGANIDLLFDRAWQN